MKLNYDKILFKDLKVAKSNVVWGYTTQLFNIGAGLLILPFVLTSLSCDLVSIWYIFLAIQCIASFDFGFQDSFTKNVTYIFKGAPRLNAGGIDHYRPLLPYPNYPLLKTTIKAMRCFYGSISAIIAVLLFTVGTWFIRSKTGHLNDPHIMIAWYIYAFSIVLKLLTSYYHSLLMGRGLVKEHSQIVLTSKCAFLFMVICGLVSNIGILSIAMSYLASLIIDRVSSIQYFYSDGLYRVLKHSVKDNIKIFPVIRHHAKEIGARSLGNLFIQKVSLLLVAIFLPLEFVGSYGLTLQIVSALAVICSFYLNIHLADLYKYRIENNINEVKYIYGKGIFVHILLYVIGTAIILLLGDYILGIFGKITLIPLLPLILLLFFQFLSSNHAMATTLISIQGEAPYNKPLILTGCCAVLLSFFVLSYTSWGILGVILAIGITNLCYNNWKWPGKASQELSSHYAEFLKNGFLSFRTWFFQAL